MDNEKPIIGSTEFVKVGNIEKIPAKIDTGADTSSVWASSINMRKDGILEYVLLDKDSPLYSGDVIETKDYMAKLVRSSHGDQQVRYRVKLPVTISGKTFETTFTLADRSRNNFPILIGRHTLEGNFLVDVSKSSVPRKVNPKANVLNDKLKEDPYEFHQKYIKNKQEKIR
ncbi:ATP-dependent zinc protease [Candidatus Saccharibacteria bacterium]|nr:ATP-dependent zinc protease [Candidatus Saccharibacteria bacterium]